MPGSRRFCRFSLLVFFSGFPAAIFAQHCPFDGAQAIVLKPSVAVKSGFTLQEIDNPEAEACVHSPGLLRRAFASELAKTNYDEYYKRRLAADFDFISGNLIVILNQSEYTCMIPEKGTYRYRQRKFAVRYETAGKEQQLSVGKDDIFRLCTNAGSWKRIKPVTIPVP